MNVKLKESPNGSKLLDPMLDGKSDNTVLEEILIKWFTLSLLTQFTTVPRDIHRSLREKWSMIDVSAPWGIEIYLSGMGCDRLKPI